MADINCIKSIRVHLGLNQAEFAALINKDATSVCLYEKGKRKPSFPTIRKIVEIANQNGMDLKYTDLRDD